MRSLLLASLVPLSVPLLTASPAHAERLEQRQIPAKLRSLMRVYSDGSGHYLLTATLPKQTKPSPTATSQERNKARKAFASIAALRLAHVYYGDAKRLYRVHVFTSSWKSAKSFSIADPRRRRSGVTFHASGGATYRCDQSETRLRTLDKEATKRFLAKAKLYNIYWRREPHFLARTARGVYFYISRQRVGWRGRRYRSPRLEDLRGFKMWRGRRGRMKATRLKDVVIDAAGQVFLTKRGALNVKTKLTRHGRVAIESVSWQKSKRAKAVPLILVPHAGIKSSWILIYRDLGAYAGVKLQLPCDIW